MLTVYRCSKTARNIAGVSNVEANEKRSLSCFVCSNARTINGLIRFRQFAHARSTNEQLKMIRTLMEKANEAENVCVCVNDEVDE